MASSSLSVVQCNRRCLSPGELPGLGTLAEEECLEEEEEEEEVDDECTGRRSFLYDSFAGGGSRKHSSSVWRRELVIAGPQTQLMRGGDDFKLNQID